MKKLSLVLFVSVCLSMLAVNVNAQSDAPKASEKESHMTDETLPAYLLARLKVKDTEDYMNRYGMPVVALLQAAGAELLSVSREPDVLEGEWDSNWTVLIKFPSMAAAKKFYRSDEYAPYRSLRIDELTDGGSLVFLEGFDPPSLTVQ